MPPTGAAVPARALEEREAASLYVSLTSATAVTQGRPRSNAVWSPSNIPTRASQATEDEGSTSWLSDRQTRRRFQERLLHSLRVQSEERPVQQSEGSMGEYSERASRHYVRRPAGERDQSTVGMGGLGPAQSGPNRGVLQDVLRWSTLPTHSIDNVTREPRGRSTSSSHFLWEEMPRRLMERERESLEEETANRRTRDEEGETLFQRMLARIPRRPSSHSRNGEAQRQGSPVMQASSQRETSPSVVIDVRAGDNAPSQATGRSGSTIVSASMAQRGWDRDHGTMLVSDGSDVEGSEGRLTPPPAQSPSMVPILIPPAQGSSSDRPIDQPGLVTFHINGHDVRLPTGLRNLGTARLLPTLRTEVNLWRARRDTLLELSGLNTREAGGAPIDYAERSRLATRLSQIDEEWRAERPRYLSDHDCERIDAAWTHPRPSNTTTQANSTPVVPAPQTSTAPPTNAGRVEDHDAPVGTGSVHQLPADDSLAHLDEARETIERAHRQLDEAMHALMGSTGGAFGSSNIRQQLDHIMASSTNPHIRTEHFGALNRELRDELRQARASAVSTSGQLDNEADHIRRVANNINSTIRQLRQLASSIPNRPGISTATQHARSATLNASTPVLSTLTSIDSLLRRSSETRSELDARRRQAGLPTLGSAIDPSAPAVPDPASSNFPPVPVRLANIAAAGHRTRAENASGFGRSGDSATGPSQPFQLSDRFGAARVSRKPMPRREPTASAQETEPWLKPLRKVTLEERLLVGYTPPKGVKRPIDDATLRVRVLRRRGVLKAR